MINVKRIAVLGMLLSAGACSRLPNVPTAYSALPRTPASVAAVPVVATPEAPAEAVAALPRIVIPGTMTIPVPAFEPRGLNPGAALDSSRRSRLAWEALRPADLLRPPVLAAGRSAPSTIPAQTYDRDAAMERLLKGGHAAASGICSGC
ncbi:hypothetical protein JHFBIEKO_0735 [Methylobacterium mesophilicum]|jgi:hypothetical protein|uniref:hypothetical protein n=2 Tax=Methylobacteriaceae TaxID=119045 RepID=UPI001EE1703E|nr:hypothetical protein [Methylobacterium mesophilicum]GJE20309.1 hypothetical protein JHFBIEKO_0735 [Methylobacterium mesophilicum]